MGGGGGENEGPLLTAQENGTNIIIKYGIVYKIEAH